MGALDEDYPETLLIRNPTRTQETRRSQEEGRRGLVRFPKAAKREAEYRVPGSIEAWQAAFRKQMIDKGVILKSSGVREIHQGSAQSPASDH